jgi:hypothetical protein
MITRQFKPSPTTLINQIKNRQTNPFYLGNTRIKREGVVSEWSLEEIEEYSKCMDDPIYFIRNYVIINNLDNGLVKFNLYNYQENLINTFNNNRFCIVLSSRQSGKTICLVAFVLWYSIANSNKNIIILANKGDTARGILARVMLALENVPFFLQPGVKTFNKGTIEFANGSRIIARAASSNSVRSESCSLLILDEFAFVPNAEQFYTSTYPIISAGITTKVIIASTANGIGNPFHKIYEGAITKTNSFIPSRVDWWDVPGRDEKWKTETIANTSPLQFAQEHGNSFLETSGILISPDILLAMKPQIPEHKFLKESINLYKESEKNHDYIITVDTGKGRGQDYSTFTVIDITKNDENSQNKFSQVCTYRNNEISPILFPYIIEKWAKYFNNAYVIIESNDMGALVGNILFREIEYENVFLTSGVKNIDVGIEMTKKVKMTGCTFLKDLIEQSKLQIVDMQTIREFSTFVHNSTSYEALQGSNDDLVMNLVLFAYFTTTSFFQNIYSGINNLSDLLYKETIKSIEDDVMPFGIILDGREKNEENYQKLGNDLWFSDKAQL